MKKISTKIDFTNPEKERIVNAGNVLTNGTKVSFCSLCKRLITLAVERIEKGK